MFLVNMQQHEAKKDCYEVKVKIPGYSYFQIEKAIIEWLQERQRQDKKVLISFRTRKNKNQRNKTVIKTKSLTNVRTIAIENSSRERAPEIRKKNHY
ncbi:hypothetical protein [Listeria aquatica]|uniref:hypothetical protein n=1 Tax=Listeria aquatica TaxID=1494960 RepID=UPI0004B309D3|nr:hypothetical protein [Listeria aquatica]